ncbi:hypothetical protein C8P63_1023 [Melghirimyces profundicolus]|uniref:Uncharacterized protein n=1 Tax=Melghirimyces profundicolus TaxID=1242148 RepID=A0A2T6C862_9BACL|nr:hypothetical protein C8P63_1023 [Melghirimyces profundicolus]
MRINGNVSHSPATGIIRSRKSGVLAFRWKVGSFCGKMNQIRDMRRGFLSTSCSTFFAASGER